MTGWTTAKEVDALHVERHRLREALDLCARANHGKAIELGLSASSFADCGDPVCVLTRDLLQRRCSAREQTRRVTIEVEHLSVMGLFIRWLVEKWNAWRADTE